MDHLKIINNDNNILSAGLLLYSYAPNTNDIYFLLGQERKISGWSGSGKWSDFGGIKHKNESGIECATRECIEETLGIVKFYSEIDNNSHTTKLIIQNKKILFKHLTERQYTYKVSLSVHHNCQSKFHRGSNGDNNRKNIESKHIHKHIHTQDYGHNNDLPCYENHCKLRKTYFRSNLTGSSKNIKTTYKHVNHKFPLNGLRVCYVKKIPWQPEIPNQFKKLHKILKKIKYMDDSEIMQEELIRYWNQLPDWIKHHPSLSLSYDEKMNVEYISVAEQWLEKTNISWWSLPRLEQMIKNGGRYKNDSFRLGFLPALSTIIKKFKHQTPHHTNNQHDKFIVELNPIKRKQIIEKAIIGLNNNPDIKNTSESNNLNINDFSDKDCNHKHNHHLEKSNMGHIKNYF